MSAIPTYRKDAAAVGDYGFDWIDWLKEGDTITTSTWTVASGITIGGQTHDTTQTTVRLSGGTLGKSYLCTNHITTVNGLEEEWSLKVQVIDR